MERQSNSSAEAQKREADRIVDEYDKALRRGENPQLEDALAKVPVEARRDLFNTLLRMEAEYRRSRGEPLDRGDYAARFPNFATTIETLDHLFTSPGDPTTADPSQGHEPETATTSVRYRDLRLYRRGGLGVVYRAQDESLHREAVVKFMNEHCASEPALINQFKVEAEITSRLDHPGIVPVYGIGEDWRGRPFYVMRMIQGRELKEAIADYHSLSKGMVDRRRRREALLGLLDSLIAACNTIAYVHHVGVIHCDIKPANIMIGKYGETFMLDWGLATNFNRSNAAFTPNELTVRPRSASSDPRTGPRGGTYGYISPEQLCGDEAIGPATDIYSLGATLYEIITGRPPFDSREANVRENILMGQFKPPHLEHSGVCRQLEAICLKAMNRYPTKRYRTAKEMADDITSWVRDEETIASPDGWLDRISRFGRRNRGATAAFFTVLVTAVVAVAWTDRTLKVAAHEKALREKSEDLQQLRERTAKSERESLETALDTLESLCRPFANGELSNLGTIRPIVDKIKTYAAKYLDDNTHGEAMRFHTARMHDLRAVARTCSGEIRPAIEDLQKAEALYLEAMEDKDAAKVERLLTQNLLAQGRLFLLLDKFDEAAQVTDTAAERLVRLSKTAPDDDELLRLLAEARHGQGEVLLYRPLSGTARREALIEADERFDQGKSIRQRLVESSQGDKRRDHRRDLARSHGYLGDVYLAQGKVSRAVTAFEESKKLREELHREMPEDPEYRFQFARALGNFARLNHGYRGDLAAALHDFEQCEAIQAALARALPDDKTIAIDLGGTLNWLAETRWILANEKSDADNPNAKAELIRSAKEAAERAGELYGALSRQQNITGLAGLARSKVLLAVFERTANPTESVRLAEEAKRLLQSIGPEQTLQGSEMVTLALVYVTLGDTTNALRALEAAVERGENTAYRFEQLAKLDLKPIADDQVLGPKLAALLAKVRAELMLD
jgi:serine/threonine protein kinase